MHDAIKACHLASFYAVLNMSAPAVSVRPCQSPTGMLLRSQLQLRRSWGYW